MRKVSEYSSSSANPSIHAVEITDHGKEIIMQQEDEDVSYEQQPLNTTEIEIKETKKQKSHKKRRKKKTKNICLEEQNETPINYLYDNDAFPSSKGDIYYIETNLQNSNHINIISSYPIFSSQKVDKNQSTSLESFNKPLNIQQPIISKTDNELYIEMESSSEEINKNLNSIDIKQQERQQTILFNTATSSSLQSSSYSDYQVAVDSSANLFSAHHGLLKNVQMSDDANKNIHIVVNTVKSNVEEEIQSSKNTDQQIITSQKTQPTDTYTSYINTNTSSSAAQQMSLKYQFEEDKDNFPIPLGLTTISHDELLSSSNLVQFITDKENDNDNIAHHDNTNTMDPYQQETKLNYKNNDSKSNHSLLSIMKSADFETTPSAVSIDLDEIEAAYFSSQGILAENISHLPDLDNTISFAKVDLLTSQMIESLKVVQTDEQGNQSEQNPLTAQIVDVNKPTKSTSPLENYKGISTSLPKLTTHHFPQTLVQNTSLSPKIQQASLPNVNSISIPDVTANPNTHQAHEQTKNTTVTKNNSVDLNHNANNSVAQIQKSSAQLNPNTNSQHLNSSDVPINPVVKPFQNPFANTNNQPPIPSSSSGQLIQANPVIGVAIDRKDYEQPSNNTTTNPLADYRIQELRQAYVESRSNSETRSTISKKNAVSGYGGGSSNRYSANDIGMVGPTYRGSANRSSTTSRKRGYPSNHNLKKKPVLERFFKQKQILFIDEDDANVFDDLIAWRDGNPTKTYQEVCETFENIFKERSHAQTIIKLIYHLPVHHYILKYNKSDGFQDVRELFEYDMLKEGLLLEKEVSIEDTAQVFMKVYGNFSLHCRVAERIKLKKQLKNAAIPILKDELDRKHSYLMRLLVDYLEEGLDLNVQFAPFWKDYLENFADCPLKQPYYILQDDFFSEREQLLLTYKVIDSIEVFIDTNIESKRIGIYHLLHRQIYSSLYCLHHHPRGIVLEREWAQKRLGQQPLDLIRSYFGEKIALYFSYKGFYISGMSVMAALGLIVFVYGVGDVAITKNDKESRTFMRLFDNSLTPWFALITSVWGLLFILFWQRKINFYRYVWNMDGLMNSAPQEEPIRHQFKPKGYRQNVITGEIDVYFPASYRFTRQVGSFLVVTLFWCIATSSVVGQALFSVWMKSHPNYVNRPEDVSVIVALMGIASMWTLRIIYAPICQKLNDWENYKTESHFEKALMFKRLSFEMINTFGRLLYFAFWRPVFSQAKVLENIAWHDPCVGPCSTDLMYQLLFMILGDLIVYHCAYSLWPLIRKKLHERKLNLPSFEKLHYKSIRPLYEPNMQPPSSPTLGSGIASTTITNSNNSNTIAAVNTYAGNVNQMNTYTQSNPISPSSFFASSRIPDPQNFSLLQPGGILSAPHYIDDKLLPPPNHTFFSVTASSATTSSNSGIMDLQIYQIIQFGYMTLFIAAFPVGGILTSISNIVQIRHEAKLYLYVHKRGPPVLPDLNNMKLPFGILKFFATVAVSTNAMVIVFASQFFQRDVLQARFAPEFWWGVRFGFVLLWHVVVFLIVAVIRLVIPAVPSHVKIGKLRQRYVERKVLSSYD